MNFTVEVDFELLEGIGSVVGTQSDGDGVFAASVDEPLGEHLLVGLPDADLHLLQVQQLLEDLPLQIVPAINLKTQLDWPSISNLKSFEHYFTFGFWLERRG